MTTVGKEVNKSALLSGFESLVVAHQRRLVALAYRMLGDFEDARDHSQEAFVRFWQMKSRTAETDIPALLTRILMNHCIDTLRRRRRFKLSALSATPVEVESPHPGPEQNVTDREIRSAIEMAAAKLKPKQKAVFVLRDLEGYSVRETAQMLNWRENNVLVNLHLARKNLRTWLTPYFEKRG